MSLHDAWRRCTDLLGAVVLAARLGRHDAWTPEHLAAYQRARFLRVVRHAQAHVPFYRDLYRGIALDDALDPQCLPTTSKKLLMENFEASVSDPRLRRAVLERHIGGTGGDDYMFGRYRVVATAGTSGLRGIFVYDRAAWRVVIANTLRWQRFAGIVPTLPRRTRICTIGADNPMHVTSRIPISGDVGLFCLARVEANQPIATEVAALNAFQPNVLLPYPSIAALLAREQIEGRLKIHPRVVATHSELLTPRMACVIEQAWGTRPFNHYGATEEPHVAFECVRHAGLHVLEDTSMLEVVDDDLRPVPAGTMGTRWLLTNLYNLAQPLIRYEITDMLRLSPERCPCGRPFALIHGLGGRSEDMLHLPRADGAGTIALHSNARHPRDRKFYRRARLRRRTRCRRHPYTTRRAGLGRAAPCGGGAGHAATRGHYPPGRGAPIDLAGIRAGARSDSAAQRMGKHSVVGRRRIPVTPEKGSGA